MAERNTFAWRVEHWGYLRTAHWLLMRVLAKLTGLRLHYVFVILNPDDREPTPVPEGYSARILSIDELKPHAAHNEELDDEFMALVEARGDVCFANFYHDELVGFSFETLERARVTEQLDVLIPPGFSYGYKGWTHPDHRLKGLNLIRGDVSRARKVRPPSIFYIETSNYASLLHRYRMPKYRRLHVGYCGWFRCFGRDVPFTSRKAKWAGLRMVRKGATPKLRYTEV